MTRRLFPDPYLFRTPRKHRTGPQHTVIVLPICRKCGGQGLLIKDGYCCPGCGELVEYKSERVKEPAANSQVISTTGT